MNRESQEDDATPGLIFKPGAIPGEKRGIMMKDNRELRGKILKELIIKARFLSYVSLASIIIFSVILMTYKALWGESKVIFLVSLCMEIFSFRFFVYARRIISVLTSEPSDKQIADGADFLPYYYYPKFVFREKKNPYVIIIRD